MKGKLVILVGPSASGKTQLLSELLKRVTDSVRLVTTTTRIPRPEESDGKDYFFVTREEFKKGIEDGNFIEHSEVYGNLYGISKKTVGSFLEDHKYVFAVIDVQGAQKLKKMMPDCLTIFIRPGAIEDIKRRLESVRKDTPKEEMKRRIDTAMHELSLAPLFDVIVDNIDGHFDETVEMTLKAFI